MDGRLMETITQPAIKGYRQLTAEDAALMNECKALGAQLEAFVAKLKDNGADPRWIAIGVTHLQQGLMGLTRSVAKPTTFA